MPPHITTVGELLDTYRTDLFAAIDNQWIKYQLQPLLEHSWLLTLGMDLYGKSIDELNRDEKQKISKAMEFFVSKMTRAMMPYMSQAATVSERLNTENFCNAFNAYGKIMYDLNLLPENSNNPNVFGAKHNNAAFGLYCFTNGIAAGYYAPDLNYKQKPENHVISYANLQKNGGYSQSSGWSGFNIDPFPHYYYYTYHDPILVRLMAEGIQFQVETTAKVVNLAVDKAQQTLPVVIEGAQNGVQLIGNLLEKMPQVGSDLYQAAGKIAADASYVIEQVVDGTVNLINNAPNNTCAICNDNCCCEAVSNIAECFTQLMGECCDLLASCCKGCGQIGSCSCSASGDCNGCGEGCGGCCVLCAGAGSMIPSGGDANDEAAKAAISQIMENAGKDASLYTIGIEAGKVIYASTMGVSAIIKTLEMLNRIRLTWDDSSLVENEAANELATGLCAGGLCCALGYVLPCGGPNTAMAFASGAYRLTPEFTAHYLDKKYKEKLNANYKQQVGISHPKKNVLTSAEQEKLLNKITETKSDSAKRDQIARAIYYLLKTKNAAHAAMRKGWSGRTANGVQELFKFFYLFNPCNVLNQAMPHDFSNSGYFKNNKIASACRKGIDQLKNGELLSQDVIHALQDSDNYNEIRGAAADAHVRKAQVPYITRQPPYVPDLSHNISNYGSINSNSNSMS